MSHIAAYAQWTGYVTWLCIAGAIFSRLATLADRYVAERRRWRNARRFTTWRPPSRLQDPGDDVTRVYPGIQRPKGP